MICAKCLVLQGSGGEDSYEMNASQPMSMPTDMPTPVHTTSRTYTVLLDTKYVHGLGPILGFGFFWGVKGTC